MTNPDGKRTVLVNLIGIDQRNRNVIEMVFEREFDNSFSLGNTGSADLSIVDLDKYGAEEEWSALQQAKSDQLAVLMSIDEKHRSPNHLFIKKPVTIADLVTALNKARNKLVTGTFTPEKKQYSWRNIFTPRLSIKKKRSTGSEHKKESTKSDAIRYLSEKGYLIDEVKKAVLLANTEGHGIKLQINNQGSIFIDPTEHWINTDLTPEGLKDLCERPIERSDFMKRVFSDREFSKYLEEWRDTRLKPIDIDAFLWDLALWTYDGALPAGTDLKKKIVLSYWPDLPRFTPVPNAMRIAALWVSCPMTLLETSEVLKISMEDVIRFYTAVSSLGLIKDGSQNENPGNQPELSRTTVRSEKNKRELYLRIIKYLKGQNS